MNNPISRLLTMWFGISPVRTSHNPSKGRVKRAIGFRPCLEGLEDRVVPTATWYQVTTLADGNPNSFLSAGTGTQASPFLFSTLLGAVVNANTSHPASSGQTDTITF